MGCTAVVGGFFGDCGKGKIVSHLAIDDDVSICARGGVGPNAGHTVVKDGKEYKLRMIPCAFVNPRTKLLIGPGVVVNPNVLIKEIEMCNIDDRFGLDSQCAIIESSHIEADKKGYLKEHIGTTGTGTGPCNAERAMRTVKMARELPELQKYVTDVPKEIDKALKNGDNILLEGTQGTFISLFHGTYPYVTSKDVSASALCSDVGIGPTNVDEVIVVYKAYVTRVGAGVLPGELSLEDARTKGWVEFGTVTGRQRRSAPFNFDLARRSAMINGATQLAVTKIDILFPESRGVNTYNDLSKEAITFIRKIEEEVGIPVTLLGTGPGHDEIIDRRFE
jgi:adenylosuccinate synthase